MSRPIAKKVILFALIALMSACGPAAAVVPSATPAAMAVPSATPATTVVPSATPAAMAVPSATPATTVVSSATSAATLTATVIPPATMTPTLAVPLPTSTLQVEPSPSNDIPITLDTVGRIVCLRKLGGHDNRRYRLAFSPDGLFFASYSQDGLVQVWDPASWEVIQEYRATTNLGWRLFSLADSRHISSGNGTIWDIASGELVHTLSGEHVVTLSPDGVWMAISSTTSSGQPIIELWRIEGWQMERTIVTSHTAVISTLAFSPDSRLLATNAVPEYSIKLWDVMTGQELLTFQENQDFLHDLAFSPDGRWIASANGVDPAAKIWDVQTGQLLRTHNTASGMYDLAFSPDGRLVAYALDNSTVELWDAASGSLVRTLPHGGELASVAFSADGTLLASAAYDGIIYLWGIP